MNVQTGCTGYVHIAAMRKMENERSIIKQAKAEVKCRKEEIFVFVFAKLYNGTVNEIITPLGVNTKFKASEIII